MKIANKISFSFLAGALILTGITAPIFYLIAKDSLRKSIYNNLATTCCFRSDHIKTYLKMLEISVDQLSKSVVLENLLKINGKGDPWQADAFAQAMKRLKRTKEVSPSIVEFMLLDATGKVVASDNESIIGVDKSTDAYFLGAQKRIYIKDVYFSKTKEMPSMTVSAPLLDSQTGELLGVLVARARLTDLNNITASEIGMGKTGEIYIVNKYGYMITPSRFKEDAILKQKVNTENVRQAWLHKDIEHLLSQDKLAGVFSSYRGVRILGAHEYIPQMQWTVLAEINAKEAFAPLAKIRLVFLMILFIVPIAAWVLGMGVAKFITGPLHRLHKGIEIIDSGNLDCKVGTDAKDEVGQLSRAFDKMMENLKKTAVSIDGLNKEITERKKAEDLLRDSEERFRTIFDNANDGILLADEETRKFYTGNNTICQMLGYSHEEIKNLGVPDIHPKEDLPYVLGQFQRQVRREIAVAKDLPVKRKDGSVFYADVNTSLITLAGRTYLLGIFRDITESKKEKEYIKKQSEFVGTIINSLQYPFYVIGTDYTIILSNKAAKERGVVEGGRCYQLTHRRQEPCSGEHICPLKEVIRTGEPAVTEHIHFDNDGNCRNFEVHGDPILDKDGQAIQMIEYSIDITERKKNEQALIENRENFRKQALVLDAALKDSLKSRDILTSMLADNNQIRERLERSVEELKEAHSKLEETQDQLIQVEKLNAVGLLASGVAHEVKNPLATIIQAINYLEGKINPDEKDVFEIVQMMKNNVKRANNIVRALVDFSRAAELVLDPEDINSILESSLTLIQHRITSEGVEIIKELKEGLPKILTDSGKMEQVFVNIFLNSIQAMPQGGKLFIRTYATEFNKPGNGVGRRNGDSFKLREKAVAIEIEDTGIGIPEENLKRIFDPFFTTKGPREGAGLGLSVTKNIIEVHKGLIEVKSEVDKGTKVIITLRVSERG